ncbi:MAG: YggS family pyridoxal phosphate-dependent enzyme [Gemmataceae bacterium]
MPQTDDALRRILAERLNAIRADLPPTVTLVAVTKTVSARVAGLLPGLGVTNLGENRPQELARKADAIPNVKWHMIGHLQRNKVDLTLAHATLIHSIDSERLLRAVAAAGAKRGVPVPILLEINCSREEAKGGLPVLELPTLAQLATTLPGVQLRGLMTMAAYTDDPEATRPTFAELRQLRDALEQSLGIALPELSMGMSNDYRVAVSEGATLVRIGSSLFSGLESDEI